MHDIRTATDVFRSARGYEAAGDMRAALADYDERAAMLPLDDEAFIALLQGSRMADALHLPRPEIVDRLQRALDLRPQRLEALGELARHYRTQGGPWSLAHLFATTASRLPGEGSGLFVEPEWKRWMIDDELAVAAYWLGRYDECREVCERLLDNPRLPSQHRARVLANLNHARSGLGLAPVPDPAQPRVDVDPRTLQTDYAACPLCGCESESDAGTYACDRHPLWREPLPRQMSWLQCGRCGHIHTRGFWSETALAHIFSRANESQLPGDGADRKRFLWAPVVQTVIAQFGGMARMVAAPARPRWLDVGFGDGGLLMTAQELGFDALGLDMRQEAVDRLAAFGYRARRGGLEDLDERHAFDVVSLCDVLEHVAYPRDALAQVVSLLRPGGLCFISLPNTESSAWILTTAEGTNAYWGELEHHHNFSASRLASLLREFGLELVYLDVSNRYKASLQLVARHQLA